MQTLTLEKRNSWGQIDTETFVIVNEGKYGFDLRLPKGNKVYPAVRNIENRNLITVIGKKGRIVFQGVISE